MEYKKFRENFTRYIVFCIFASFQRSQCSFASFVELGPLKTAVQTILLETVCLKIFREKIVELWYDEWVQKVWSYSNGVLGKPSQNKMQTMSSFFVTPPIRPRGGIWHRENVPMWAFWCPLLPFLGPPLFKGQRYVLDFQRPAICAWLSKACDMYMTFKGQRYVHDFQRPAVCTWLS